MKLLKALIFYFLDWLDIVIPKSNQKYVFTSFPDFSDNAFALYLYVIKYQPEVENIWLIDDMKKIELYLKTLQNYIAHPPQVQFVKKNSFKGFYHFLTARYVFFTHGIYKGMKFSNRHQIINLWHGMPLKKIGYLDSKSPVRPIRSHYITVTSSIYQKLFVKAFKMPERAMLITGQIRNELLLNPSIDALKKLGIGAQQKIVIWMPTYRQSIVGDIRIDGELGKELPLFKIDELKGLNRIIEESGSFLIIKLHPMDYLNLYDFPEYSHIRFLKNKDFEEKGIQLYSLLGQTDILLTDYSSVFVDYLLTGKPIGFVLDDIEQFEDSRGFVFDNPLEFMPGKIINSQKDFIEFIKNPVKHPDYNRINDLINEIRYNFAHEMLSHLSLKTIDT